MNSEWIEAGMKSFCVGVLMDSEWIDAGIKSLWVGVLEPSLSTGLFTESL